MKSVARRSAPEDYEELPPLIAWAERDAPHNGTPTSIAAAASVAATSDTQRAEVLAYIAAQPHGATREEIEIALHLGGNTVRPRAWELLGNGGHVQRIRESGARRKTVSGRWAETLVEIKT